MKLIYTKHAEDKLKRADIKRFNINKITLKKILENPRSKSMTKYCEFAATSELTRKHDLRIIYDIIGNRIKIITFHIARKVRYK